MTFTRVSVLFTDYNDIWGSLSDMYWSQQTSTLISRHPISSVEEIYSLYCPQCMSRYSEEEAIASFNRCTICRECPNCSSAMQTDTNHCAFCLWNGSSTHSHGCETIRKKQDDLFRVVLSCLKGRYEDDMKQAEQLEQKRGPVVWHTEESQRKNDDSSESNSCTGDQRLSMIKTTINDIDKELSTMGADVVSLFSPVCGVLLRSKKVLRGKQDSRTGRMNILVQPKILPLEGDSSLKLQKGKWWVKDSSAVNELPFISVTELPVRQELFASSGPCFIELCFTNPKMTDIHVSFSRDEFDSEPKPYLRLDRLGVSRVSPEDRCFLRAALPLVSAASDEVSPLKITIGGFEDELLKDMDDAEGVGPLRGRAADSICSKLNAKTDHDSSAQHQLCWAFRVVHNKAFVQIPVELHGFTSPAPLELELSCQVDLGAGGNAVTLSFKIILEYPREEGKS